MFLKAIFLQSIREFLSAQHPELSVTLRAIFMKSNQDNKWPIALAIGLLCLLTFLAIASWNGSNPLKNKMASNLNSEPDLDGQKIQISLDGQEINSIDPVKDLAIGQYPVRAKSSRTNLKNPSTATTGNEFLKVPSKSASYVRPLEKSESTDNTNVEQWPIINEIPQESQRRPADPENPFGDSTNFNFDSLSKSETKIAPTKNSTPPVVATEPAMLVQPNAKTQRQPIVESTAQKSVVNSQTPDHKIEINKQTTPSNTSAQKVDETKNALDLLPAITQPEKSITPRPAINITQGQTATLDHPQPKTRTVPKINQANKKPQTSTTAPTQHWPLPTSLIDKLQTLQSTPQVNQWCRETITQITGFKEIVDPSDDRVPQKIKSLYRQIDQLDELIAGNSENTQPLRKLSNQLKRIRYDLMRRLEIWRAVHHLAITTDTQQSQKPKITLIKNQKFSFDHVAEDWNKYLELENLQAFALNSRANSKTRKRSARTTLARATSNFLNREQFDFVSRIIDQQLAQTLRNLASDETNVFQFLADLEAVESNNNSITQYYLNDHYQDLYWSTNAAANRLADVINVHYRNANIRVSISEKLLNRLIPNGHRTPLSKDRFGKNGLMGATSVESRLRIDVQPDTTRWRFRLETVGWINSRTRAYRESLMPGEPEPLFNASKDLVITSDGQHRSSPPTTKARTLLGSHSRFDRVPVYGLFARRGQTELPIISSPIQNKIETATNDRFEKQVQQNLQRLTTAIKKQLADPISAMELEPTPIEMKSTEDRIIMRYRLAGHDQMSSCTTRPMAQKDSVMSCQIHESAINNFIAKSLIGGKKFTLKEFASHFNRAAGNKIFDLSQQQTEPDVDFVFANADPIRLDFDNHTVMVTLRLKQLRVGPGVWRNITVISTYDISAQGLRLSMSQREPGIRLRGKHLRLRDQIAVRTVFQKLLKPKYSFSLDQFPALSKVDLKGLWISQLVFADGWLGISISDRSIDQNDSREFSRSGARMRKSPRIKR